jgi:LCP family protein required for cell wall assembly
MRITSHVRLRAISTAAAAALAVVALVPRARLLSYGGDRQMLFMLGTGLVAAAFVWLIVALVSHRLLEPDGLPPGKRLGGALVVMVSTSLVVAPMSIGASNAFTQRDLIGAISGGASLTTPEINDQRDPWADIPSLNVLLMGSDAGDGRDGIRPDTLIVASIDTHSGDTTTISLPRNLMGFPFPEESPLSAIYPQGWLKPPGGDDLEYMLNATFRNLPALHPEAFEGSDNPGADATKWAVEGALGIDIDYFMMVNLEGFAAIVDALGGVTLDVPRDLPIGNKELPGGGCTTPRGYVYAGENQQLDGTQALWFARSRCGADDYDRMVRQQCVISAIVDKVEPTRLLTQYQSLASATMDMVETDVPEELFKPLIELMVSVQGGTLESLTLDRGFFRAMGRTSANPDYDQLHVHIAEILEPADPDESEEPDTTQADTETPAGDDSTEAHGEEPSGQFESPTAGDTPPEDPAEGEGPVDGEGSADDEDQADDEPVETDTIC